MQKGVVHNHLMALSSAVSEGRAALKSDYHIVKNGEEIVAKLSDLSLMPQSLGEDKSEPIRYIGMPERLLSDFFFCQLFNISSKRSSGVWMFDL